VETSGAVSGGAEVCAWVCKGWAVAWDGVAGSQEGVVKGDRRGVLFLSGGGNLERDFMQCIELVLHRKKDGVV
jgi:hypothetical protein